MAPRWLSEGGGKIFPFLDRGKLYDDPVDEYIKSHYEIEYDFGAYKILKRIK